MLLKFPLSASLQCAQFYVLLEHRFAELRQRAWLLSFLWVSSELSAVCVLQLFRNTDSVLLRNSHFLKKSSLVGGALFLVNYCCLHLLLVILLVVLLF